MPFWRAIIPNCWIDSNLCPLPPTKPFLTTDSTNLPLSKSGIQHSDSYRDHPPVQRATPRRSSWYCLSSSTDPGSASTRACSATFQMSRRSMIRCTGLSTCTNMPIYNDICIQHERTLLLDSQHCNKSRHCYSVLTRYTSHNIWQDDSSSTTLSHPKPAWGLMSTDESWSTKRSWPQVSLVSDCWLGRNTLRPSRCR